MVYTNHDEDTLTAVEIGYGIPNRPILTTVRRFLSMIYIISWNEWCALELWCRLHPAGPISGVVVKRVARLMEGTQ